MKIQTLCVVALFTFFSFTPTSAVTPSTGRSVASFTLKTEMTEGGFFFRGLGGAIDGKINPTLSVKEWDVVKITLFNNDGVNHHIAFPDFFITSHEVMKKGTTTTVTFVPFKTGGFIYYCILNKHRELGMEGKLVVTTR
ncbi:MAG: hypothetical protein ACE5F7_09325 [Nitrospiria bacterium]